MATNFFADYESEGLKTSANVKKIGWKKCRIQWMVQRTTNFVHHAFVKISKIKILTSSMGLRHGSLELGIRPRALLLSVVQVIELCCCLLYKLSSSLSVYLMNSLRMWNWPRSHQFSLSSQHTYFITRATTPIKIGMPKKNWIAVHIKSNMPLADKSDEGLIAKASKVILGGCVDWRLNSGTNV